MGQGRMGNTAPRHARVSVDSVPTGTTVNWFAHEDVDSNHIPARIVITDLLIDQPESTVRATRVFAKSTRINDPSNAEHSLIYEDNYTDDTEASDEQTADRTHWSYIDEDDDLPDDREASIWGTIGIRDGEDASAFLIDIYFTERG